jgi:choline dehydrogenase
VLKRPNLTVIISATVTKVIFDKAGDKPRAVGVELTSSRDGPRFRAEAKKEVILWWVLPSRFSVDKIDFAP